MSPYQTRRSTFRILYRFTVTSSDITNFCYFQLWLVIHHIIECTFIERVLHFLAVFDFLPQIEIVVEFDHFINLLARRTDHREFLMDCVDEFDFKCTFGLYC